MDYSRRDFLGKGLLGFGAAASLTNSWAKVTSDTLSSLTGPDIIIELTASELLLKIDDNRTTKFWSYVGKLIKGPKDSLKVVENSYLGPIINVKAGDNVRIIFKNSLPEKSIVHWHGLDVSHENDGHPHFAINTNGIYTYDFVVENRAGMYWYHPHPHGRTGFQVYQGLAGLFIVRDNHEVSIKLPNKEQELNLVLQDKYFDKNGKLEYRPSMMGAFGNKLLVNGKIKKKIKVKKGLYRIRLLNGCNARVFNMALDNGDSFKQIGSDGGLLKQVNELSNFYFAPAERFDFLLDFSKYNSGEVVLLESLPLVEGRGTKYTIIEFEILDQPGVFFDMPTKLSNYSKINPREATNYSNPTILELIPKRGTGWTINGNGYEANSFEKYEIIRFGESRIWEFYNPTGMPHPMHIHGTQFQIIDRKSGQLEGCLDEGWKDTVLVMPGDRVKVIKRFNTFRGTFIYHCHNLEHEDMSMMRNFKVI